MKSLPLKGLDHEEILKKMADFKSGDADHANARTWSLVYHLDESHDNFLQKAHNLYFSENGLNPMAFKSLKRFEHDIIQMAAVLLNGDDRTVGTMTSGGTESCLLPVLAYRERARSRQKWDRFNPQMIAPETVHVAWDKAAKYFGIKMVKVPVTKDFTMDLHAFKKKINQHTIMVVASAPSYPHGVIDPIEDIAKITEARKIPFHVDACLGGFFLPFLEKNGYYLPKFDFRCKGVTSISADVHKYGFGAKGASTVLYKDISFMKHQFFIHENWPGGVFASPALLGTRPGGPIAAAWAAMHAIGEKGYQRIIADIMATTGKLIQGIQNIEGLKILGDPLMSVFSFAASEKHLNIYAVGDLMEEKGWHIDRLQKPEALHAMVTPLHETVADQYLSDLKEAVSTVKADPGLAAKGNAAMYGMIANVPFRGMIRKEVMKMMENLYGPDNRMPMETGQKTPWPIRFGSRLLKWFS